ncbi:hypothetical protein BJF83_20705 [Nocardiopsis sp. CNR-923]|nr:hypothetical protein BJF83_20705 [Nocardiopsis sp. CNR-923]
MVLAQCLQELLGGRCLKRIGTLIVPVEILGGLSAGGLPIVAPLGKRDCPLARVASVECE